MGLLSLIYKTSDITFLIKYKTDILYKISIKYSNKNVDRGTIFSFMYELHRAGTDVPPV